MSTAPTPSPTPTPTTFSAPAVSAPAKAPRNGRLKKPGAILVIQ
jgi:hypothetical protein